MIKDIIDESKKSDKLYQLFMESIDEVDDSLSYEDLAETVADIIKNEYGSHNIKPFLKSIARNLNES